MPTFPAIMSRTSVAPHWGSSVWPENPLIGNPRMERRASSTASATGRDDFTAAQLLDRITPNPTSARAQHQRSSSNQHTIPMLDPEQSLPTPDFPYPSGSRPLSHDLVSRLNPISPQPDSSHSMKDFGGGRTDSKIADDAIYLGLVSLVEAEFLFRKSVDNVYFPVGRGNRFHAECFLQSFMEKLSPLIGLFDPDCECQSTSMSGQVERL